jgi:hypothetical protein
MGSIVKFASPHRTPSQVADVSHVKPRCRRSQPLSTGRNETAEPATRMELLHPSTPTLGAAPQPSEDPRQLRRDRGLPRAKESPRVSDQQEVASERESFEHPLAGRIQPTSVLDRAEPQRLFQSGRGLRTRHAATTGGFQPSRLAPGRQARIAGTSSDIPIEDRRNRSGRCLSFSLLGTRTMPGRGLSRFPDAIRDESVARRRGKLEWRLSSSESRLPGDTPGQIGLDTR